MSQQPEIHLFDPEAASPPAWAAFHAFRRARAEEDEPGEPMLDDADFEHAARRHWPLQENRRLVAEQAGTIVGSLGFGFRREGTPDYADHARFVSAWGGVLRPQRRQGIATALLQRLFAFMDESGKTTATFGVHLPEGDAFLTAIGAVLKHRSVENRMDFAGLDWTELAAWQDGGIPEGSRLAWEIHAGRVPLERLASLLPQFNALLGDMPLGALDLPPIRYEMPRTVAFYEELDRRGGEHFLVLLTEGDTVAAMCDASWDARFPDRVYQALTAVAPAWRGRGLAKAVKAAMLRLLHDRHPSLRMMITSNAEVNAPMLSINRRLGFRVHRREASYQITRP